MEYVFSLFCKIRKIFARGVEGVVEIDTKINIYINYTNDHQKQPNPNKDNNDNTMTTKKGL